MWQILTNFWTFIYIVFIVFNFARENAYDFLVSPMSALYIGVLSLYVGSKEFDRWYANYRGRRHGELFVVIFSVVILALLIGALVLGESYKVPSDIVATYIAILSIFILTQKSKRMYEKRRKE